MSDVVRSRVIVEWGCFEVAHQLISDVADRPLLIASPGSIRNGRSRLLCDRLADAGCHVQDLVEVGAEPTVELVDQLSADARRLECESVIALGGGAVIDTAKAIAATSRSTNSSWALTVWGRATAEPAERAPEDSLPVIAIPTIAGSGSEGNGTGVLINRKQGSKAVFVDERLQPSLAIVDPSLTVSVPEELTWAGALDIAAHALEAQTSDDTPTESRRSACTVALNRILAAANAALRNPSDRRARTDLSRLAFEVWDGSFSDEFSRWPLHAIAHVVGARFGTPHAWTVATLLPHWLAAAHSHDARRLPEVAIVHPQSFARSRVRRLDAGAAESIANEVVRTYGDGSRIENAFPLGISRIREFLLQAFASD